MESLKALAIITGVFIVVGLFFTLIVWLATKDIIEPKDKGSTSKFKDHEY